MPKTPHMPRNLEKPFSRLIDLIPVPHRYQEQIQKDILLFLKLEGKDFVRNKIEQSKKAFLEKNDDNSIEMETDK
jgi:hypothetical protein